MKRPSKRSSTSAESPRPTDLVRRNRKLNVILHVAKEMSSQRDLDALLDLIMDAARQLAEADRCSLFIHDRDAGELWAKIAQGMESQEIRMPADRGVAGYVATTKEPQIIGDAYADSRFNDSVDQRTGYRTRNILCVPMLDNEGEVTGVIQALNKTEDNDFNDEDVELLLALGGQAAVAVENALLHADIERLFAGFIKASVYAIEARDPTTHGHSERVADLTVELARMVERETTGPFRDMALGEDVLRELRYASLLHDFGKVGVREPVLLKAQKLYPEQLEQIRRRFTLARRDAELTAMQRRFELLQAEGRSASQDSLRRIDLELQAELERLRSYYELVVACDRPTVLAEGDFHRLREVREVTCAGLDGQPEPLIGDDEVEALSIPKGSLTSVERQEIESHVQFTYRFLERIPWTRDLRRIPEIAYAHHEKLDGAGYPRHLKGEEIPIQSRMMSISDVYDALTAADRPYKKALPAERALDILSADARRGVIDAELLRIFVEARVFRVVQA